MYSVVAGAINHPDAINPYCGLFNHRSLRSLADAGTAVDVVSPRPYAPPFGPYSEYGSLPRSETWGPYRVHHPRFWYLLPKQFLYSVSGRSYANRIPPYIESNFETPDVVHACHLYPDGYGLLPYATDHDLPLFVTAHGKLLNNFEDLPPGVPEKIRTTLDAAAGVFCVSDALAEKARQVSKTATVETVPIGADPSRYPVGQRAQLRQELGIDQDATVVLFVGEFTERKGIEEITELLPDLQLEKTEFVFVGHGGGMLDDLKQAVSDSEFSAQHIYTGITSLALRRWFALSDLLLLPSHAEGRPTVIYEAMASETAVLASDVGGVSEQVVDGETGVLIPPKNVDALETALASLTGQKDELREMQKAGNRRLHQQNWTWQHHAERLQELHLAEID